MQGYGGKTRRREGTWKTQMQMEDNIKMDLQEVERGGIGLDRSGSGQREVAGTCECGNEPSSSIKCGEFLD